MTDPAMTNILSITVEKQIIRANGMTEPVEIAAYAHRDPEEMERFIAEHGVEGRITGGSLIVDLLNDVTPEAAQRIMALNERKEVA